MKIAGDMAKRRHEQRLKKAPNILDSYLTFRDMDDEEFGKTFGGTKDTIINSWLYLLYLELKQQFETEPGAIEEGQEVESEGTPDIKPEDEKAQKRRERRQRKLNPKRTKIL
jgi:hypothetical protein